MKPLHMQCNSLVVRTRARESFPSSVSCFRSRTSTMSLNPTDYVKQFSGLARIRVTENREESSTIEMSVTQRGLGFHSFDETKWSLTFIPPRSIALQSSDSFFLYAKIWITYLPSGTTHTPTHKSTPQKSRRSYFFLNEMAGLVGVLFLLPIAGSTKTKYWGCAPTLFQRDLEFSMSTTEIVNSAC